MKKERGSLAFTMVAFAMVTGAHAQEPGKTGGKQDELTEIVVTATRTVSNIQRTPMTVSAITSEALQRSGTVDTASLQAAVPGLTFTSGNVGQTLVYLRGTGTSILGLGAGTSVATYVDGVYLSNQQQALQKFSNIERIEVLKGPQATLYGRNATAGTINIITRAPGDKFSVEADAEYGNYDALTMRATVDGPISERIGGLVSVLYDRHDGYARNVTLDKKVSDDEFAGVRGTLRFDLTPEFALTVRGDYGRRNFSDYIKDVNPNSFLYRFNTPSNYVSDPRKIRNNFDNDAESRDYGASVTLNADLAIGQLTSVTSYRKFRSGPTFTDIDSNDGPFLPPNTAQQIFGDKLDSKQLFQEIYLSTDREAFAFATVGGTYHSEEAQQFVFRPLVFNFTGVGTVPQTFDRDLDDDYYSVFIDGGLNLTERVKATAGARYSHDRKIYSQDNAFAFGAIPAGLLVGRRVDEKVSPRFGIEFQLNPELLIYGSATSGFKAGGFAENDPRNTFKPESIWSYEVGFKSNPWDRRARLNMAFFYADYTDLQVQQIETGTTVVRRISNADSAKIKGVDFEASVLAARGLTLSLSGEYLDTEMGDSSLCHPTQPCSGVAPPFNTGIQSPSGHPLPNAPKWSLTSSADFEIPLGLGSLNLHADASYRSRAYFTYFGVAELPNGVPLSQPAYTNVNAQVEYASDAGWSVALYGRNLTDKLVRTWQDVISQYSSTAPLTDLGTVATTRFAPPRTYGVRLGYKF